MTHAELVERADAWLRGRMRCVVACTELASVTMETPDAIGWTYRGMSILVECKASRSDFRCDAKKTFRRNPQMGMGRQRFYMTPPGLVGVNELPEGWGLVEAFPRKSVIARHSQRWPDINEQGEKALLISTARRALGEYLAPEVQTTEPAPLVLDLSA